MSMNAIIVDDESLARSRIKKLVNQDDDVSVVGEFELGKEAIQFINSHDVDIVFLDIHMPEIDGFKVLEKIDEYRKPFIIFVTADQHSAMKAFEVKAIDYLLKPFRNIRFFEALENAKKYVKMRHKASFSDKLIGMVDEHKHVKSKLLKLDDGLNIDFNDILYIESERNYLKVFRGKTDYILIRKTMKEMEAELDSQSFIRIHKSLIVNSYFIQHKTYLGNNEFIILLSEDIQLKSSRSYKEIVERINIS